MKSKLPYYLLLLTFTLIISPLFAASCDDELFKVLVNLEQPKTFARLQSYSGNWTVILADPVEKLRDKEQNKELSRSVSMTLGETQDVLITLSQKGLAFRAGNMPESPFEYKRIIFKGGDLISVTFPPSAPMLFEGELSFTKDADNFSIRLINQLPLNRLLAAVASQEAFSNNSQAVKAHIIALRTKLLYFKRNSLHKAEGVDICNQRHCVKYQGIGSNKTLPEILVKHTDNKVLTYKNQIILPRYHHTCGGKISSSESVYGIKEPYHIAQADVYRHGEAENCMHSPSFRWLIEINKSELETFLSLSYASGASYLYTSWKPEQINNEERITSVKISGKSSKIISGIEFLKKLQKFFGSKSFKSARFKEEVMSRTLQYTGKGEGDGVGMCLYGADGLAKKGKTTIEILNFYYPGTEVKTNY